MSETPPPTKKPNWTKQETILALELYLRAPGKKFREPEDPEVVKLSDLLNAYHRVIGTPLTSDLRNPNGVSMKLGNFMRMDPDESASGLVNGAKLEEEVWEQYANNREQLKKDAGQFAEFIRSAASDSSASDLMDLESVDDLESEGDPRTRVHRSYERKRGNRKKKIKSFKRRGLPIACECCGFDFEKIYGERGRDFIEVHHSVPVSELAPQTTLKLSDLRLLCANCHRMVHRHQPWLAVEDVQALIS